MSYDLQLTLSDAQAVTADAVSTNTIDLGNPTVKNEIGAGEPVSVVVTVDVGADFTTGDETYAFQLIQSANANLSSPDVLEVRTLTAAQLVAATQVVIPIPIGAVTKRYLGLNYDVGGTTPTMTITAFVQPNSMIQQHKVYAKGYTVS